MPRTSAQCDFVLAREPEPVALPQVGQVIELPLAKLRTSEASATATKWVMRLVLLTFILLGIVTVLGHIPAGE